MALNTRHDSPTTDIGPFSNKIPLAYTADERPINYNPLVGQKIKGMIGFTQYSVKPTQGLEAFPQETYAERSGGG